MTEKLLGLFRKSLDDKNRIVIPSELRKGLEKNLYAARWYENSIALFEEDEYLEVAKEVHSEGSMDPDSRLVRQEFFGGASMVSYDKQGRMMFPEHLMDILLMNREKDRDLVIAGDWNKILIHSGLRYDDRRASARVDYDDALSRIERTARDRKTGSIEGPKREEAVLS